MANIQYSCLESHGTEEPCRLQFTGPKESNTLKQLRACAYMHTNTHTYMQSDMKIKVREGHDDEGRVTKRWQ